MKKFVLILCLLLSLALVACGSNEAVTNNTSDTVSEAGGSEPVEETAKTHTFMLGEEELTIEVPREPKSIVVIGYDLIDIVDALGHKDKIVGTPDPKNPMFPDFLEGYDEITSVGSLTGDDLEAVAGLKPDLILAGARTFNAYQELAEIAPTVYFTIPGMNSSNFEEKLYSNIEEVAFLLNDEEKGSDLINDLKGKFVDMANMTKELEDKSAMFLIVTGKAVNVYSDNPESRYGFVYNEFGFESIAALEEIAVEDKKVNNGEASRHGNSISFEFIAAKDPNYLIVLDRGAAVGQDDILATDTLDNALVNGTKAGQNNNIIYLNGTAWYLATGGYEATDIMLNNLKEALGK